MYDAVICEPVRTAVGRYGGALKDVPAAELAATVIRALLDRTGVPPAEIDDVRGRTLRMSCLASLAGAPALSLPAAGAVPVAPVGICLVGAPGSDAALLALAAGTQAGGALAAGGKS